MARSDIMVQFCLCHDVVRRITPMILRRHEGTIEKGSRLGTGGITIRFRSYGKAMDFIEGFKQMRLTKRNNRDTAHGYIVDEEYRYGNGPIPGFVYVYNIASIDSYFLD